MIASPEVQAVTCIFSIANIRWMSGLILCCSTLFVSSGCSSSVELYGQLQESECNIMLAKLVEAGIAAEKSAGAENTFLLNVPESQLSRAIDVLHDAGLPKSQFRGFAEEFPQSGLISSPLQERVRYMHALSEELAKTISKIDGVIDARVHIVLPESTAFGELINPSSASVFIKHSYQVNLDAVIPEIKSFIRNSVEGLSDDMVSVVLVESAALKNRVEIASKAKYDSVFDIQVRPSSKDFLSNVLYVMGGVGLFNLLTAIITTLLWLRSRRTLKQQQARLTELESAATA